MTQSIEIIQPDDFHVHLREGKPMREFVKASARVFKRVLVMPNTTVPVVTGRQADEYRLQIKSAAPDLFPVMSIYLTKTMTPETILEAHRQFVKAVKFYPKAGTTNAGHGLTCDELMQMGDVFRAMQECGMILLLHGEDPSEPMLRREVAFFKYITRIAREFPKLKIVFEHITTYDAVKLVKEYANVAATITAHHLVLTTDAVIGNHDCLCMPVAKSERDRKKLAIAAMSGHPRIFFGSDSAPHPRSAKHQARGAFGIYAPNGLEVLTQLFEQMGKLKKLENFTSKFGAEWYELPQNTKRIELYQEDWTVPDPTEGEHDQQTTVRPFMAGQRLAWKVRTD